MAHERLSPRQKMIGMMYLVLTAMLALNVSKEAVEAFKKVDKGLTKTIENYAAKNSIIYDAFDKAAAQNPAKAGPAREKAISVKQRADELFNYMQDLKVEIISTAEGPETLALKGKEVIIEEVKKIDENNVPSEILIGANENGKANDLKALIASFRDDMIDLVGGKNVSIEESLNSIFNTEDGLNKSGEKERWENLTFQALPLVAVITILSKMQVDVRNAETDVITHLYEQIDARSFKFNKIIPTIKPTSTYVMIGNEYQAEVFLSATDTTQSPVITIGDYTTSTNADGTKKYEMVGSNYLTLTPDETGKASYKVRPGSLGQKGYSGLITIKAPDGTIQSYPFNEKYSVGESSVTVSPTAMNVLYAGIENPIDISVPAVGSDKVRATMKNGIIDKGKLKNTKGEFFPGDWKAQPTTEAVGQIAQIIVSAEINGRLQQFPPRDFRIKSIPKPVATFANKSGDVKIAKDELLAQQAVFANLEGFDFDLRYAVTEFKMTINVQGFDRTEPSTNNRLTDKQKALLTGLTKGKKLFIEGIKAVGPDKKPQDLSPIIITVN
jgi:gliding motility-associated protein GldM